MVKTLKTLTTAAGLVMLVSSFAVAGQTPTKPVDQPKAAQSHGSETKQQPNAKKHHKHHKKHHTQSNPR